MNDLPWHSKAAIGAVGGIALAMLKLIEAKFFLASIATVEAQAAYLTYFCYMILGSVAAVFLSDHELPSPKVRRSAFVLGLLAPSVLLAMASQTLKPGPNDKDILPKPIPSLGWLPMGNARAQQPDLKGAPPLVVSTEGKIRILSKDKFEPKFGDAFSAALGRSTLVEPYLYVIGSTEDKDKALSTAHKLTAFLSGTSTNSPELSPQVLQVAGDKKYFVVLGGIGSQAALTNIKMDTASVSIKAIGSVRASGEFTQVERKSLAALLIDAPVVPAKALITQSQ